MATMNETLGRGFLAGLIPPAKPFPFGFVTPSHGPSVCGGGVLSPSSWEQ